LQPLSFGAVLPCTDATKTLSAGKAAIGGPFDLADGDGKTFTEKDLLGEFALLYFGFTFCPDICPDELEKMARAVNSLGKEKACLLDLLPAFVGVVCSQHHRQYIHHDAEQAGKSIQPVFISVDPERDSPKQVKQYVKEFHPRMLGLTGTIKQVSQTFSYSTQVVTVCYHCQQLPSWYEPACCVGQGCSQGLQGVFHKNR